jgi:hypothetical protein
LRHLIRGDAWLEHGDIHPFARPFVGIHLGRCGSANMVTVEMVHKGLVHILWHQPLPLQVERFQLALHSRVIEALRTLIVWCQFPDA